MKPSYKQALKDITTFIFDVDGVLTDSSVILMPNGDQARVMSVRDGYALQLAVKKGYNVCIISGGTSETVRTRLNGLGITEVFLGASNKDRVFKEYIADKGIGTEEILYMGDDIPDHQVMQQVGVPTCPNNAAEEIKAISAYVSVFPGGKGCARDVIEQTMKVQGKWFQKDSLEW